MRKTIHDPKVVKHQTKIRNHRRKLQEELVARNACILNAAGIQFRYIQVDRGDVIDEYEISCRFRRSLSKAKRLKIRRA